MNVKFYTSAITNMATVLQFDVTICQVYHGQNLCELEFRQINVQQNCVNISLQFSYTSKKLKESRRHILPRTFCSYSNIKINCFVSRISYHSLTPFKLSDIWRCLKPSAPVSRDFRIIVFEKCYLVPQYCLRFLTTPNCCRLEFRVAGEFGFARCECWHRRTGRMLLQMIIEIFFSQYTYVRLISLCPIHFN